MGSNCTIARFRFVQGDVTHHLMSTAIRAPAVAEKVQTGGSHVYF